MLNDIRFLSMSLAGDRGMSLAGDQEGQTEVVKTGSNGSTAKRLATIGVSITGPWR